ncbi:hypothetical protein [Rahnella contaminans]|uniref:hypothetical protein n=1 Tax=Rahnella contaminans TaxID=2703882 RepID=UPI001265E4AE|nr:hypothetical protein [Rahnella contaminans]KAB8310770.1 hypothetical protein EH227_02545 [Rouxiella chamberiensis]MDF1895100.1 hypothetical protein [Rahnella contaminans]
MQNSVGVEMDARNLERAHRLMQKVLALKSERELISKSTSGGLGITIQSKYQDDEFVNAVRPAVVAEISRRIQDLESQLQQLGLEFNS